MSDSRSIRWDAVTTANGYPADQVISALQKEIRRGNTENAVLLSHEMILTSGEMEEYLWQRLAVISVEDIGLGNPNAAVLVNSLIGLVSRIGPGAPDRELFAVHAVRYLCGCTKDRSSDEMTTWVKMAVERGETRPQIPEYALDMHTAVGKAHGRGLRHFLETGAVVNPELPDRDTTYRDRILAILDSTRDEPSR